MIIALFDLDETLIDGKLIDSLALKYGFYYDLNRLRTNLKNGLMSYEKVTESIFKFLKGKTPGEIIEVGKSLPLTSNTERVINSLKNRGIKIGIISDNFSFVTDSFAERFGLDYSIGHDVEIKDGKLTGNIYLHKDNEDYLTWKKEEIKEIRKKTDSKIIAVGNGDIDAPMLEEADIGIAFNATPRARKAADIVVNSKDMNEVLDAIDRTVLNHWLRALEK